VQLERALVERLPGHDDAVSDATRWQMTPRPRHVRPLLEQVADLLVDVRKGVVEEVVPSRRRHAGTLRHRV